MSVNTYFPDITQRHNNQCDNNKYVLEFRVSIASINCAVSKKLSNFVQKHNNLIQLLS